MQLCDIDCEWQADGTHTHSDEYFRCTYSDRPMLKAQLTPGPRKQTSAGQGLINISVITDTGESWEGRCTDVSHSAK